MKVNITITLKNQDELNSLLDIIRFYTHVNVNPSILTDKLSSELYQLLIQYKKDT